MERTPLKPQDSKRSPLSAERSPKCGIFRQLLGNSSLDLCVSRLVKDDKWGERKGRNTGAFLFLVVVFFLVWTRVGLHLNELGQCCKLLRVLTQEALKVRWVDLVLFQDLNELFQGGLELSCMVLYLDGRSRAWRPLVERSHKSLAAVFQLVKRFSKDWN